MHATSRITSAGFSALDKRRVSPGELRSPTPFSTTPMNLKIPTDEALGLELKRIISAVALVAVAFYAAGYTLGTAVHRLNASLSRLPAALPTITPVLHHDPAHPLVPAAHGNDRPRSVRPRQPQRQSRSSGVGFA